MLSEAASHRKTNTVRSHGYEVLGRVKATERHSRWDDKGPFLTLAS